MSIKDYVTKEMLIRTGKKIGKVAYDELVYPAAKKIVKDSSTPYDNLALTFLDDLVKDLLEEK